jgi:hypothetical protein
MMSMRRSSRRALLVGFEIGPSELDPFASRLHLIAK